MTNCYYEFIFKKKIVVIDLNTVKNIIILYRSIQIIRKICLTTYNYNIIVYLL